MNRHLALLTTALALAAAHCYAREPQAPPSPSVETAPRIGMIGKDPEGKSIFVGHYGETIEIPYGWTTEAEMRGETEAIYFHAKYQHDHPFRLFQPKKSEYKPENFAPMGLMELVVIPKNAPGGLRSLKAIRLAKEKELKEHGVDYAIFEVTSDRNWPWGTFTVVTKRPYRIAQTYAESSNQFYILTVGGGLETGDFGLSEDAVLEYRYASNLVDTSLGKHLLAVHKRSVGEFLFHYEPGNTHDFSFHFRWFFRTKDTLAERRYARLMSALRTEGDKKFMQLSAAEFPSADFPDESAATQISLCALSVAMMILAIWPGKSARVRRVRFFGRSLLLFMYLMGLAGFLVVYIPARFFDALWNSDEIAALIPVLIIPLISWATARRLGSAHTNRVFASTGGLAALWATLMLWDANRNMDTAGTTAFDNTLVLLLVGLTFGIVFGLSFGTLPKKEERR